MWADHPLRCYVGDMSHRLGTVDIGDKKKVFSDPNLPLEGAVSAMGRSLVIFTPNKGHDRAEFISDVRDALAVPEWIITVDSRKTKTLHDGTCVQFLVHFKGPDANDLELLFSRLMDTGRVDLPRTATSQGSRLKRPFGYQNCNADDNIPKKKTSYENPLLGYSNAGPTIYAAHVLHLIISITLMRWIR
ncbi:hypothetical protein WDU94_002057 [Cyamophila willieti]